MNRTKTWIPLLGLGILALGVACGDDDGNGNGSADVGADGGGVGDGGNPDAGDPVVATTTVDVTGVFEAGAPLRDAYSGRTLTVGDDGRVEVPLGPRKVALLERDGSEATPFSWDNATVYFLMTDRFENGDPSNDDNFGRSGRTGEGEVTGTWHGGDFAGIVDRMDYLVDLGVDALWITPPVEQMRGWVSGGTGDFQHFPYHGYWASDFTKLDPNYGTEDDLRELVSEAHDRGIRVIFDMVMNHPSYLSLYDTFLYVPEAVEDGAEDWLPGEGEDWNAFNEQGLIDYSSSELVDWWGPEWIRAGAFPGEFPGYDGYGPQSDPLTYHVGFLPDFKTEDPAEVSLPPFFADKAETNVEPLDGATVRDYLVEWHTRWVREFGIDAFRCDTAKHVEFASWQALKDEAVAALDEWKQNNPDEALDDLDFWMVGEAFPPTPRGRPNYFDNGFDALINFDFQDTGSVRLVEETSTRDTFYSELAEAVGDPNRNELTYASSHDTMMFFEQTDRDLELQFELAPVLLLNPGAVQIYYGDETAREAGPSVSDRTAPLRSDMNWDDITGDRQELLEHWQRIGRFRRKHRAVGAGNHAQLPTEGDPAYAFSRQYDEGGLDDDVVVVLGE